MSLSRTAMTQDEAINLASLIDTSHLPVHVKRVTAAGVVEVQDDTTGYVLPIVSAEHWRQYAKQQGESNSIDEFASAGVALMSHLDTILTKLRAERDSFLTKAEQYDAQASEYQKQRDVIEAAIKAVDGSLFKSVKTPAVNNTATPMKAVTARIQRTRRPANLPPQKDWIAARLQQDGRIKVSLLASEMSTLYGMSKERAATNISGEMSRMMKSNPNIQRIALGEFTYTEEEKHNG